MKQKIINIKIIKNNETKNWNNIIDALNKTLTAKKIKIELNDKLIEESNLLVLTHTNKNNEKVNYFYKVLSIDFKNELNLKTFYEDLKKLSDNAVCLIPSLKTALGITEIPKNWYGRYKKSTDGHISIIYSLIFYKWLEKIEEIDIFDMAADLFIRMAQTQYLPNGNKRNAVLVTNFFLSYFSFYTLGSRYYLKDNYLKKWTVISRIAAERKYRGKQITEIEQHKLVKERLQYMSYFNIFKDML